MIDQSLLNTQFKIFLQSEGASEKTQKNYSADLEDFFITIKSNNSVSSIDDISEQVIHWYIDETLKKGKSISTINRRLSTLRIFFKFIQHNNATIKNPMEHISNVIQNEETIPHSDLVRAYEETLIKKGVIPTNIDKHKTVVENFLKWVHKHPPS